MNKLWRDNDMHAKVNDESSKSWRSFIHDECMRKIELTHMNKQCMNKLWPDITCMLKVMMNHPNPKEILCMNNVWKRLSLCTWIIMHE